MLPMCQAKQMWRGDNIYFHNSEQIWRAASLSSGACSCRKPNSLAALEVFIAPLNLPFSEMGCFLLMWGPGQEMGVEAASGTAQKIRAWDTPTHPVVFWIVWCQVEADLGADIMPPNIQRDIVMKAGTEPGWHFFLWERPGWPA